ncbi:MAG: ECF transporter S component [Andreesenia angusta]|nr:ECF transporter S component [Andreesenia angusta]
MKKSKKNAYVGILIALSFIGSMIKIQNSIAFDSTPAFLGALLISPQIGGLIGLIGHLISAALSGFSLTLPMHIIISLEMFVFTYIFGILYKINKILAGIVLVLLNGVLGAFIAAGASSILGVSVSGMKLFAIVILPLFLGSLANTVLSIAIYEVFLGHKKDEIL